MTRGPDLSAYDLEDWGRALDALAAGEDISWLESGRSPRILIAPRGRSGCSEVSIYDVAAPQIVVTVPLAVPPTWLDDHRAGLGQVKRAFALAPWRSDRWALSAAWSCSARVPDISGTSPPLMSAGDVKGPGPITVRGLRPAHARSRVSDSNRRPSLYKSDALAS